MDILKACKNGDIDTIKLLLKDETIDPTITDESVEEMNILHIAAKYGYTDIVKLLLNDDRFDLNQKDDFEGFTPLKYACIENKIDIVKLLLNDERVNINEKDNSSYSCLFECCLNNHYELAELILTNKNFDKLDYYTINESYNYAFKCNFQNIVNLINDLTNYNNDNNNIDNNNNNNNNNKNNNTFILCG